MSEHEVLINFHSEDMENVTTMCSQDENLDWMEPGSKMQLLSRDATKRLIAERPLCPPPLALSLAEHADRF